jgi:hypothetical protein
VTLPIAKSTLHLCNSNALYAALCRKQLEIRQVQKEIEALSSAIVLLTDVGNELARSPSRRSQSETRAGQYGIPLRRSDLGQQAFSPALEWFLPLLRERKVESARLGALSTVKTELWICRCRLLRPFATSDAFQRGCNETTL